MNAINSQCNDSLGFNLLECADDRMIAELIEVTDQYVCKTQIALQLSPCNLQEANEVHTFSQVMRLLGEDLVTNGNKLHWLSEKLITNLSGDRKEMDNSYTRVDKLDSTQNQTADENLEKSPETSKDKSFVTSEDCGSTSQDTSEYSDCFMSDFSADCDTDSDQSDYIPKRKKKIVSKIPRKKCDVSDQIYQCDKCPLLSKSKQSIVNH